MVMVEVSMSKQMGQVNSDCRDFGETAISVVSVIASCGVLEQRFNTGNKPVISLAGFVRQTAKLLMVFTIYLCSS